MLHSYETKLLVLEDNVKNTELIVDKFVQLVHEEEKKRGRTGFMSDSRVSGTPSARIVGQSAAQALQRCLLEDEGDKQLLRAKLTRVSGYLWFDKWSMLTIGLLSYIYGYSRHWRVGEDKRSV